MYSLKDYPINKLKRIHKPIHYIQAFKYQNGDYPGTSLYVGLVTVQRLPPPLTCSLIAHYRRDDVISAQYGAMGETCRGQNKGPFDSWQEGGSSKVNERPFMGRETYYFFKYPFKCWDL